MFISAVPVLYAVIESSCSSHIDTVPLRGYTCKSNAQKPCSLCPEGFYCSDKDSMQPCGNANLYCPPGSVAPTLAAKGFYTKGPDAHRHSEQQCEEGFFCVGGIKKKCSSGFQCPVPGLSSPIPCGHSGVFCEEGSIHPTKVRDGYFSFGGTNTTRQGQQIAPVGFYAFDGIIRPCPPGSYGCTEGLSNDTCSGICEAGWYCPESSISPRQIACGGEDRFCPPGSPSPTKVTLGHYTSTEEEPCRPGLYRKPKLDDEVQVSPIASSRADGKCVLCEEGYKHLSGDDPTLCLDCGSKAKSTSDRTSCECHQSPTEKILSPLKFDPVAAKCYKPSEFQRPDDFYPPGQMNKAQEMPCEPGYYCDGGTRYRCPGGRYGSREREVNNTCTGACAEGHFCGEASTISTENKCGAVNLFCPQESAAPIYVSEGFYTNEDSPEDSRISQHTCPKGFWCKDGVRRPCAEGYYGDSLGLKDSHCSGSCSSGYYCLSGSPSSHQYPCGNSTVYCPKGSKLPRLVERGFYSASVTDSIIGDGYGPNINATRQMQVICETGYYCKYGIKYSCPAGTYGVKMGATDVNDCKPCPPGKYCPSHPGPPTTEDTQLPCGNPNVYCPPGSPAPATVDLGFYSINESYVMDQEVSAETNQMTSQVQCEPGFYCKNGVQLPCRGGTYGSKHGLTNENCSGLCPRAFFCPENSVDPLPCSPGTYSTGGAKECTSCEFPPDVPAEVILNSMCRDDRSCCLNLSV